MQIHIKTIHKDPSRPSQPGEVFEENHIGSMLRTQEGEAVFYEQHAVTFGEASVSILQKGETSMHLKLIADGTKKQLDYETPFGVIPMEILTRSLKIHRSERGVFCKAVYLMFQGEEATAEVTFEMSCTDR